MKWLAVGLVALILAVLLFAGLGGVANFGNSIGRGVGSGRAVPPAVIEVRRQAQVRGADALGAADDKQILFGDLHVHTSFSADAFIWSLPAMQGDGVHPPADACDFARFCSGLDFWSINDHAEDISPTRWAETREAIRECNAAAGDPDNPDLVSYLGWEWTQLGITPESHYGHKNVIVLGTEDEETPTRPIAARRELPGAGRPFDLHQSLRLTGLALTSPGASQPINDLARYVRERGEAPVCPDGVHVRELDPDCYEDAATPGALFEKLDQWDLETMVIPHGTTWGFYTPAGTRIDKHLRGDDFRPDHQPLFEIFSGHGNSEEYRTFRAARFADDGEPVCPSPTANYLPSCWRAGEIIRARCEADGEDTQECEERAVEARRLYLEAGQAGHRTVPGVTPAEWLDSGQCRDCFLPSFNYRAAQSGQRALALTNFDDPANPRRFRFGFMASSDNHSARPGTGYKEFARLQMTEARGSVDALSSLGTVGLVGSPESRSEPYEVSDWGRRPPIFVWEAERQSSFFLTGGLIAVHSEGRDRNAIWNAMERKEVYGTSGDHILLWFDLMNPPSGGDALPMGSEVAMSENPRFRVRAAGSFEQRPGCPESSRGALGEERLESLCRGECFWPSDVRRRIVAIEVIRIRPQERPDESVAQLIEDPWMRLLCPDDPDGCSVEFEDPDFDRDRRDTLYYVRALQAPSGIVNGAGLRCEYDQAGECISADPCFGNYRGDASDDCLAEGYERAWSSPIYVDRL